MTTGELIRKCRKEAGLTQKELGERAGIAEPTIRKYESNRLNPKIETLQKIADALGVTTSELSDTLQHDYLLSVKDLKILSKEQLVMLLGIYNDLVHKNPTPETKNAFNKVAYYLHLKNQQDHDSPKDESHDK